MSFSFNNWFPNLVFGTWRPDTINGTERRDIIITFAGNDSINAKDGDDLILSGAGNDTISAGNGDDIVDAGAGDDAIEAGAGDDTVNGGRGFDTAIYAGSIEEFDIGLPVRGGNAVTVRDLSNGDTDRLSGVEALYFGNDDYTLFLDGRNNSVLARDDSALTDEDTTVVLAGADLTANDSDFDGDTITVTGVSATSALGATVTLENGTICYEQGDLFDSPTRAATMSTT